MDKSPDPVGLLETKRAPIIQNSSIHLCCYHRTAWIRLFFVFHTCLLAGGNEEGLPSCFLFLTLQKIRLLMSLLTVDLLSVALLISFDDFDPHMCGCSSTSISDSQKIHRKRLWVGGRR